eukprot:1146003-Pelagomonas_calceolata.AAC.4
MHGWKARQGAHAAWDMWLGHETLLRRMAGRDPVPAEMHGCRACRSFFVQAEPSPPSILDTPACAIVPALSDQRPAKCCRVMLCLTKSFCPPLLSTCTHTHSFFLLFPAHTGEGALPGDDVLLGGGRVRHLAGAAPVCGNGAQPIAGGADLAQAVHCYRGILCALQHSAGRGPLPT